MPWAEVRRFWGTNFNKTAAFLLLTEGVYVLGHWAWIHRVDLAAHAAFPILAPAAIMAVGAGLAALKKRSIWLYAILELRLAMQLAAYGALRFRDRVGKDATDDALAVLALLSAAYVMVRGWENLEKHKPQHFVLSPPRTRLRAFLTSNITMGAAIGLLVSAVVLVVHWP